MPRYSIRLSASDGETKPLSRYCWARDRDHAAMQAQVWLDTVRHLNPSRRALDTWSVATGTSPYLTPVIVATGHAEGS
jgi:hypothetical protein